MRMNWIAAAVAAAGIVLSSSAHAWSENGHDTVGAIADSLINGTPAQAHVSDILGTNGGEPLTLSQVAVWADCARSVKPGGTFPYVRTNETPQGCSRFEDDAGESDLSDYAARNNSNCTYKGKKQSCHEAFHFADVYIKRGAYKMGYQGTSTNDVVHAINAAIDVLQDKEAPAPFDITSKKEALMLLVHFVGDIHQPLHVGVVYLNPADGTLVDPDHTKYDDNTNTAGGNFIQATGGELHGQWDHTNFDFTDPDSINNLVTAAGQIAPSKGDLHTWAEAWASDTIAVAGQAYVGINFSGQVVPPSKPNARPKHAMWPATFDDRKGYVDQMRTLQQQQVVKGGARLAKLLQTIWPN
jgi:hypothetical protein